MAFLSGDGREVIGNLQAGGAWYKCEKVPVSPTSIPSYSVPRDPIRATLVKALVDIQPKQLHQWNGRDGFTFDLPRTEFSGSSAPVCSLQDLMQSPDASELADIVRDDNGNQRRIGTEMIQSLKQDGTFSFPSVRFAPLHHVWKVPSWLQKGKQGIQLALSSCVGFAVDQLVVHIPRRLGRWDSEPPAASTVRRFPSGTSIVKGVQQVWRALVRIVDKLIGIPRYRQKMQQHELRDLYENSLRLYMNHHAPGVMQSREYRNIMDYGDPRGQLDRYGIPEEEERLQWLEEYKSMFPNDAEGIEKECSRRFEDEEVRRLAEIPALGRLGEDVPDIVREEERARFLVHEMMDKLSESQEAKRQELEQKVREEHPWKSSGKLWLADEVDKRLTGTAPDDGGDLVFQRIQCGNGEELQFPSSHMVSSLQDKVVEELETRGDAFAREAKFQKLRLKYLREKWPVIEETKLATLVPEVSVKRESIDRGIVIEKTIVESTFFGWRLVLFGKNVWSIVKHGLEKIVYDNLWFGNLGIQALFRSKEIQLTGRPGQEVFSESDFHTNHSLRSRLRAIWAGVRARREAFESAGDVGFLSKDAVRWLHIIKNYVITGGVSSILCIVVQPILTVVNIVVSTVLVVTAPIWALLWNVLRYLLTISIFDQHAGYRADIMVTAFDSEPLGETFLPRRYSQIDSGSSLMVFPLLRGTLSAVVFGPGQILVAGASALIIHPVLALGGLAWGSTAYAFRQSTDATFRFFLARFGRWPATDTWLAKRISGPGIASTYYYRIDQETIAKCLRARLEDWELGIVTTKLVSVIGQPEEMFRLYCVDTTRHILGNEHLSQGAISGLVDASFLGSELWKRGERLRNNVHDRASKRRTVFQKLLRMPMDVDRIRPAVGPEEAVTNNVEQVRRFYESRLQRLGDASSLELWQKAHCQVGDMVGLTKYLMTSVFSSDFLVELEVSDRTLIIPVEFEKVLHVPGVPGLE